MSLAIGISSDKHVSKWVEYKNDDGVTLAKFKIRGVNYKPYKVALDRSRTNFNQNLEIKQIEQDAKTSTEMLITCCAYHLIEDWSGLKSTVLDENGEIVLDEKDEPILVDLPFSQENALNVLLNGDIGVIIWDFIDTNAKKIQYEHDIEKAQILGKLRKPTTGSKTENMQKRQRKSKTQSTNT